MGAFFYVGGKFVAYSAWCYFGLRTFQAGNPREIGRALVYGAMRLLLGFVFGILIYVLSSALVTSLSPGLSENLIAYLAVYVPVRWIEWSIMTFLILPGPKSPLQWIAGTQRNDRLWRLGGIAISCLADIPLIAGLHGQLPVGRFLC
jgi:hypothetical protein